MDKTEKTTSIIQLGIFAVIYIVILGINAMLMHPTPITLILLPVTTALTEGIVFALYMTRVNKRGMVFFLAMINALLLFAMGHTWLVLLTGLIFGLIGDFIIGSGNYKDFKTISIGYMIFQLWLIGIYLPIWFSRQAYIADLAAKLGNEFATTLENITPVWVLALLVILILIAAFIGINIGKKVCQKTFKKAGIV